MAYVGEGGTGGGGGLSLEELELELGGRRPCNASVPPLPSVPCTGSVWQDCPAKNTSGGVSWYLQTPQS